MKPLFQQQCEALVKTLTKAKANEDNILHMYTWVDEHHSCGTAACVCGYQALSNDLSLFMEATTYSGIHEDIANNITYDLDNSCYDLFGNKHASASIYSAHHCGRLNHAQYAEVADEKTLRTFKHLTRPKPSLDDAIEYINFVIQKC